ncbi:MAG: hypothetical protein Q4C03_04015 [bacterium]|nr:hypothetical protein [bacterium]
MNNNEEKKQIEEKQLDDVQGGNCTPIKIILHPQTPYFQNEELSSILRKN